MNAPLTRISDAEWQVMQVLWKRSPLLANEIADALGPKTGWNHRTVKTLISRLVKKRAIRFEKADRAHLYRPIVDEKTCVHAETRSFVERFHGGALKPLVAAFIEHHQLSKREIAELKELLERESGR